MGWVDHSPTSYSFTITHPDLKFPTEFNPSWTIGGNSQIGPDDTKSMVQGRIPGKFQVSAMLGVQSGRILPLFINLGASFINQD